MMSNADIAATFARIAMILDLKGDENPFRIRAYQRAATTIEGLRHQLSAIYEDGGHDALRDIPGIGADLAKKIEEMVTTGNLDYMATIEKKIPKGVLMMLDIEGIGPKRAKFLWKKFGVIDLAQLVLLAKSGKLENVKGWGEKSVANILKGIEENKIAKGRLPYHIAKSIARDIEKRLKKSKLCKDVAIAGSLRRKKDTVGDIDILVTSAHPKDVMDLFCSLPNIERVLARGTTRSSVFLKDGLDADLRVVDPNVFGAALQYFTGSKEHNVKLRRLALKRGYTISEYGVYHGRAAKKGALVASKTEEDVYTIVGLPWIPPEYRLDHGEIEAAEEGRLEEYMGKKKSEGGNQKRTTTKPT
jgi:DNA polymerase (family 10)